MKETSDEMKNTQEKGKNFFKNIFKEKEAKTSEFIGAIIGNIIILYIVNSLLSWNLSFIAPSFQDVLWIFNLSLSATIIANIIFLLYHPGWFRSIIQIILNILGFWVCYFLYTIFPFTFSQIIFAYFLKFALIVAMIVIVIASLVEVVKLILRTINAL
ncbi:hypothetical protein [Methanobacterium ferruginis]|uniref:hypothetical protein n=1 Tax=Methanobacterium ferruginis TaxID=710191 RepID=UPI002573EEDB|nr:hypothetical protein [Methanobacterium ferruginis]BDZ68657.1 hypothetical protein GCM10025860_21050 [Methanobacterium ferruginis]